MSIKDNLLLVRQQITAAAERAGRDPREIKLVGVIKNVPNELVIEALENGLADIGENRVQEAGARFEMIRARFPNITWHMIGHLQRNKVGHAIDIFDIIHSVDSERLAREIEIEMEMRNREPFPVLVEINTSGEETKYGIPAENAIEFLKNLSKFKNLKVQGLMTMAALTDDPEKARLCFRRLKELSEKVKALNFPRVEMRYLSMGMSDDFSAAIEEGSNLVRVGRAIFQSARSKGDDQNGRKHF